MECPLYETTVRLHRNLLNLDVEPPVVDYCESPPEFITDSEDVVIEWDQPIFHDNSRSGWIYTSIHLSRYTGCLANIVF